MSNWTHFRIGIRSTDKKRPLKIIFENNKNRRDHLSQAQHIKLKARDKLKTSIITADMTPSQRDERKRLLQELDKARLIHKEAKISDSKIIIPNETLDLNKNKQK